MAIICSNCQNYSYSAYKTLCTLFVSNAYFMAVILVSKRKSQNSNLCTVDAKQLKKCVTAAFFSLLPLISCSPRKRARELHMALI